MNLVTRLKLGYARVEVRRKREAFVRSVEELPDDAIRSLAWKAGLGIKATRDEVIEALLERIS